MKQKSITEEYKGAVKKAFRRYHILVDSMLLLEYESGRREIYLTAKTTNGRCVTSKDAAELMESVFPDTTWLPAKDSRSIITRRYETVRFEEKWRLLSYLGCCGSSKNRENATRAIITVFVSEAAVRQCSACVTEWEAGQWQDRKAGGSWNF